MTLNVAKDGTINLDGQPFGFAAFYGRVRFTSIPTTVVARQIPYPFTVEGQNGTIATFQAMDYLLDLPDGTIQGITQAEFQAKYDMRSGVTV